MSSTIATAIIGFLFLSASVAHIALNKHPKILSILTKILLSLYIIALFAFTLSLVSFGSDITINFESNGNWFSKAFNTLLTTSKRDFLINISMMYPIGYSVSALTKSKLGFSKIAKSFVVSLLLSFTIEGLQFALPISRNPSVLDILLNTASGIIGAGAFIGVDHIIDKANKFIEKNNKEKNTLTSNDWEKHIVIQNAKICKNEVSKLGGVYPLKQKNEILTKSINKQNYAENNNIIEIENLNNNDIEKE